MRFVTLAVMTAVVLSVGAAVFAAEGEGESVALTVYNDGNAIVKERRFIEVPQGGGEIRFTEVAKTIDPTSVTFRSVTDPAAIILEQNYEYDLVNASKILQKYIGSPIRVTTADGTAVEGALLSFSDNDLVISRADGLSVIQRNENVKSLSVGELPEGLILEPTLMWMLSSRPGGRQLVEVAYSADGCGWEADYIAILDEGDTVLDLSGWVTLTNQSGRTYENARLKLVAGEVHRTDEYGGGGGVRALDILGYEEYAFQEKAFAEYHLYTLPRPTTVKDNQVKQIELLNAGGVPVESKKYLFDLLAEFQPWWGSGPFADDFSVEEKGKVRVYVIFRNDQKSNLAMPLPAGRVRFFKRDGEDLEFVGEDRMEHTPKDERIELLMGSAFDLAGERTRTDFRRGEGQRWMDESFRITLRNHKEQAVTVNAREHMFRWVNWEIVESSAEFEKLDARTIQFPVQLAPDEEKTVTYKVRYTW